MKEFKKLLVHTSLYGLAPFVPRIASIFALPFITPHLTSVDYGIMGIIEGYLAMIFVFGSLGIRVVLVNSFYRNKVRYKFIWRQLFAFLILWGIFYGIVVGSLVWWILPDEARENTWIIVLAKVIIAMVINPVILFSPLYYQLNQNPKPVFVIVVLSGLITVGLNLLFISKYRLGYMGWIYSEFIASFVTAILYLLLVLVPQKISPIFNFKWSRIKSSLRVALPAVPHFYSGILLKSSDKVILNEFNISPKDIGLYSLAANFDNYFNSLGLAIGTGIGPQIREYYTKGRYDLARKTILITTLVFLLFCFLCSLWLKEIFSLLIQNDELKKVYPIAIILIMGQAYRPLYLGFSIRISYEEKTNELWKVTLAAAAVNVVLNLFLVSRFGYQVAAITTFTSYIGMGLIGYYTQVFKKFDRQNYFQEIWSLVFVVTTFVVYNAVELDFFSKLVITFLAIGISLFGYTRFKR